jgi:hypothetical protein
MRPMKIEQTTCILMVVAGLLCAPGWALAQDAIAAPAQKTIGESKTEMVPSLIVMNSRGANLQGQTLTLTGVSPNSIVFADRPVRAAGHALTANLLEEWAGGDSFGKDPPNATVSVFSKDGSSVHDTVVILKSPKMNADQLTFDVQVLEGDLTGADGPAAVFIDIVGRALTPRSYAGVARRTAYRAAWYRGPVHVGAPPYGYVYTPPSCGYFPYPPCY